MDLSRVIAIDIGASKMKLGFLVDGTMREIATLVTPADPEEAVELIATAIDGASPADAPEAVGIGCPGPLDPRTGVVLSPPNLRRWWGFPLREEIERRIGVPARVDNDGNVGALGEAWAGSGCGYATVLYFAIGTGLGAGIRFNTPLGPIRLDYGVAGGRNFGEGVLHFSIGQAF